jgi:hypothetical protein
MGAHTAPTEIFRTRDVGVQADHNAAVIESTMRENGNRCYREAAALQAQKQRYLQLANIEFKIGNKPGVTLR